MKNIALIMAGGCGERLWPKSTDKTPKQFLKLLGNRSALQMMYDTIHKLIEDDDIYVITNERYRSLVKEQLPTIKDKHIIGEVARKNTLAAIGYASCVIKKECGNCNIITLSSDIFFKNEDVFLKDVEKAFEVSEKQNAIVCFGMTPNSYDTGMGYIKFLDNDTNCYKVLEFKEKPTLDVAIQYVDSKEYLWNLGIFVGQADLFLEEIKKSTEDVYDALMIISNALDTDLERDVLLDVFPNIRSLSFEQHVVEKAPTIFVFQDDYGWTNTGDWNVLDNVLDKDENSNSIKGDAICFNSNNCIIEAKDKLVTAIGVEGLIIVETENNIMICNKDNVSDIKSVIKIIREIKEDKYL